jgi:peptidoglycan-N-acetylglucosamine deacetylase
MQLREPMKQKPSVSVVVPAYNEEELIAQCISSLKRQDYGGDMEIIVVDNASTDQTYHIANAAGVRVVRESKRGYVHAMRAGFSEACGDIITCIDADTMAPAGWISKMVRNLQKPGVVACTGVFTYHDGPFLLRLVCQVAGRLNYHLAGANMGIWRYVYLASGGFNSKVNMGADVELGQRIKKIGKLLIDRTMMVKTSGRRFQFAFFQTLWLYYVNDIALHFFNRPAFYDFPNIRKSQYAAAVTRFPFMKYAVAACAVACFVFVSENTENRLFGSVFAHGRQNKPLVALTFDDGPSAYTANILDTLSKYDVHATFFLVGQNVERHPDVARRIVREGNVVGNHTYSHPFWAPVETPSRINAEIDKAAAAIRKACGVTPEYFRPPHGWRSPWMMSLAKQDHYTVVTWTVSPDDWQKVSAATIEQRVLSRTGAGSIILLHDGIETKVNPQRANTVTALPEIIRELKARGYTFVTLPELIRASRESVPRTLAHFSNAPTPVE